MAAPGQLWELPVNTDMTLTTDLVRGVFYFERWNLYVLSFEWRIHQTKLQKKKKKTEIFQGCLQGRMFTTE